MRSVEVTYVKMTYVKMTFHPTTTYHDLVTHKACVNATACMSTPLPAKADMQNMYVMRIAYLEIWEWESWPFYSFHGSFPTEKNMPNARVTPG